MFFWSSAGMPTPVSVTSTVHLFLAWYDIKEYMEDKLSAFRMAAVQKEIELYLEIDPEMSEVWLDKNKMDHIMDNLLSSCSLPVDYHESQVRLAEPLSGQLGYVYHGLLR